MNELKPCPFCGGEAELEEHRDDYEDTACYNVGCNNPRCEVMAYTSGETPEGTIAAWNRRASLPEQRTEPDHSKLTVRHLEPGFGFCHCEHCSALPIFPIDAEPQQVSE